MDTAVLSSQLQSFCEANRISGVIRVTHKDQILHSQSFGYACRETQTPFAPDSMFSLYSLSKPFCAIGLLLLADQGLVDIDAHPGKYVPEAKGFDSRVTIRQLLQHPPAIVKNLLRPFLAALTMGIFVFASFTGLKMLGIDRRLILCGAPIAVGVLVYVFAAVKFKVVTREDCLLLPKGEKIAKLLKL